MTLPPFLSYEILGNTLGQYLIATLILLVGSAFRRLFSRLLSKLLFSLTKRYTAGVTEDELHELLIQPLSTLLLVVTLQLAGATLMYPHSPTAGPGVLPWHEVLLLRILALAFIVAAARVALRLVDFALLVMARRAALRTTAHGPTRLDNQFLPFAKDLLKVFFIIIAVLVALGQVFGVNVTALIGGLGIGGLAVAFAAKESLENLIASFTIFLDQPFGVGDLVTAGSVSGTVEKIGFRSTRLRTAEKSYVTVPNKSMIDKPLDNLSLRTSRRVGFTLTFDQKTTSAQLHAIIAAAVAAMQAHPLVTPDAQMKFSALTPAGKEVTVQYFVQTTSYDEYLNVKEDLNYSIVEVVEQHGGSFAGAPMVVASADKA
ncbi:mechanosensitive ion channel family protein [Hymenobacter siberiensis]|jgi:MscS family membrane protein|uniref:mechanosensitive ion channel family protein n=1 Tax=Hymenobacter siberiensis TaxID=2848396 RepID=UPI001C1E0D3A|nr:mechanosensitive ion channel family protein [Hymenobacter siberiensis]MBU6120345.1 mechanosensitive ion channel family protein [Hymenobacter siberiensis]